VEVGPDHYFHVVPARQPLSRTGGLPPSVSGLKVVTGSWGCPGAPRPAIAVVVQWILQQRHAQGDTMCCKSILVYC